MLAHLRRRTISTLLVGLAACLILFGGSFLVTEASPLLQTAPTLGTVSSFAVLGGSTVTNTGPTIVNADLGVSPGTAVTGFPPGSVVGGTIHAADALAAQAQADTTTAYNSLAGQSCPPLNVLTGQDLGGMVLVPGVYCFSSSAQLTGTLTLNALGSASSVFIFQIGSTLTTATNSSVIMTNPGSTCNVFWQVGSSATLGTTTHFMGSILALTSIGLTTGATVNGRALARNGAVTMDSNTIGTTTCVVGLATATATAPSAPPPPRPASTAVLVPTVAVTATTVPTATALATATTTTNTAATATAAAVTAAGATQTAVTAAGATQTAVIAAAATQTALAVANAAATATALAARPAAALAPTATPLTAATAIAITAPPAQATPAGLAGRAGGLDPIAIAGGLGLLGALVISAGLWRRRRASG